MLPIRLRTALLTTAALIFVAAVALTLRTTMMKPASSGPAAGFVGSQTCAGCHAAQHAAWQTSDHHRAMQAATAATVLGDFNDAVLTYFGRRTTFGRRGEAFVVTTESQQGSDETFSIAYTLGHDPLQQYLVRFDDGRIQALPFAWDARPGTEGGQRWFHLYPGEDVSPDDPLFWTRPQQNWNHMCGDCHTTNFAKNFDDASNRFDTRWSEMANGCESCHGAGAAHVEASRQSRIEDARSSVNGLHSQAAQLDQCGVCHARRVRLQEVRSRESMLETWRPELLSEGLYHVDGQIRDEVFEIGSFLQSRMAAEGVTCTDCHDPHTASLKAEGNALCTRCHDATNFDTPRHHFHPARSRGAECVSCHMPARTYMLVDDRRDHRFAAPRPDASEALGTPDVCTGCHTDRTPSWAAGQIRERRVDDPGSEPGRQAIGRALWQVRREQTAALASIAGLVKDQSVGSIAKATATAALGGLLPESLPVIQSQLTATDPLIRLGAVQALSGTALPERLPLLLDLVQDPSRAVRLAVAPLVAGADKAALTSERRGRLEATLAEYRTWLAADGDRAEALVALAGVHQEEGALALARAAFDKALERDETSLVAHLNFADFHRAAGNDRDAEPLLRKALDLYPDSASARFAWGLWLVRQKRTPEAAVELQRAADLAPDNSDYAYVHAVSVYSTGRTNEALSLLARAEARFPANTRVRDALGAYCAEQTNQMTDACRSRRTN